MAKSRAFSLPGALGKVAKILNVTDLKIEDGKRLIKKFSIPHTPTKKNTALRILPENDPEDAMKLYEYNLGDIKAEAAVSEILPDLSDSELELWLLDQKINFRGVHIDKKSLNACITIVNQAFERDTQRLRDITDDVVQTPSEVQKITGWLGAKGLNMPNLKAETVTDMLSDEGLEFINNHQHILETDKKDVIEVLKIRASLGAASVKKLFAIDRRLSEDGRLRDLFSFCGADRTGRFAGRGPQPQNLPASGPDVRKCGSCGRHYNNDYLGPCLWCGGWEAFTNKVEWNFEAVEDALAIIATGSLATVEVFFGDAVAVVSGCLRALFSAAPGHDLICSDYAAIEAVVLAVISGEQWRVDVFNTHGKLYETCAAKITGIPFEDFLNHKKETGEHHPLRKKLGKVPELASGYGGWIGAWKAFGADKYFDNDQEIKSSILTWRNDSPAIVEFWGGQVRKHPDKWEWWPELHGLEGAVVMAILNPGECYSYRDISYGIKDDILYCQLPSGRKLCYHNPRLTPTICRRSSLNTYQISYMGWNSDHMKGPIGWMELETYGGKLAENVTQAIARDILTYAMKNIERAGYHIVLHVHDEIVSEVPEGTGSIEEFESIMGTLPSWAAGWPVRAAGGWRGKRYRKD
jgi:DNA polymerase